MVTATRSQAWMEIDLDAYRANLQAIAAHLGDTPYMAVVKADGYGHGAADCALAAREAGAAWLGVATPDEALSLRGAGDLGPLLCWLAAPGADWAALRDADVEVTASSAAQLAEIVAAAPGSRVQLKVDTGLARNGAFGDDWTALVAAAAVAQASEQVVITGVWSHFACADEPDHPANDAQERVFRAALDDVAAAGLQPVWRHLANSAAALTRPSAGFDLVRIGIASYGISPAPALELPVELRPVMTVRARLAQVKRVPAGTSVSYGHRFTTERETTLGLVPVGYADGLHRRAANLAEVAIGGQRVRQVGVICMDQIVVDLGDLEAERGDLVTVLGTGDDGEPTAQDWAEAADTIGYEIVTGLGGRLDRIVKGTR